MGFTSAILTLAVMNDTLREHRRNMDIKTAKADHKARQKAVVKEVNENIAQHQALEARMKELIKEADMLNGEARILERLSKDNGKTKKS